MLVVLTAKHNKVHDHMTRDILLNEMCIYLVRCLCAKQTEMFLQLSKTDLKNMVLALYVKSRLNTKKKYGLVEFQGHMACPSNFYGLLNIERSVPMANKQETSLDSLSHEHTAMSVAIEEEEMDEMHLLPVHPA